METHLLELQITAVDFYHNSNNSNSSMDFYRLYITPTPGFLLQFPQLYGILLSKSFADLRPRESKRAPWGIQLRSYRGATREQLGIVGNCR
jgi:hypothetical protein